MAFNDWERWVWADTLKGIAIILLPLIALLILVLIGK